MSNMEAQDPDKLSEMSMKRMLATKCPTKELSFTNCAVINPDDFPNDVGHIKVCTGSNQYFVFTIKHHCGVPQGMIGFSLCHRKWANLSLKQEIEVQPYCFDLINGCLSTIILEANFLLKESIALEVYDTNQMAKDFQQQFSGQVFTMGQQLKFQFKDKKMLGLVVKSLEAADVVAISDGTSAPSKKVQMGCCLGDTNIQFKKAKNSNLKLVGKAIGKNVHQSIINSDWDFERMGIGGMDTNFSATIRRIFASRIFPREVMAQLECKYVKGILLYGQSGTGKTLMAKQIGSMLNTKEPKIINGTEIVNQHVEERETNIRKLFADAEDEEKRLGSNSGLHIIIFDEIEAICKSRGSVARNKEADDTAFNQLIAKIDGVEQLNNIFVIGITNDRNMVDQALLTPGRLEVQLEISLPNENGRLQILNIHTSKMKDNMIIAPDVDLKELAFITVKLTGADLENLVKAAQIAAMNRLKNVSNEVEVDPVKMKKIIISRLDFLNALKNDIKPVIDNRPETLDMLLDYGIINWGTPVIKALSVGNLCIQQARSNRRSNLISVLLEGPSYSGKTALAAHIAKHSNFPYIKLCRPKDLIGYNEFEKCQIIRDIFDDAYCSQLSCILIDDIDSLLDYGPTGPRHSILTLQMLIALLKKKPPNNHKLLLLCTSSRSQILKEVGLSPLFKYVVHVPTLSTPEHLLSVLNKFGPYERQDLESLYEMLRGKRVLIGIKNLVSLISTARQIDLTLQLAIICVALQYGSYISLTWTDVNTDERQR